MLKELKQKIGHWFHGEKEAEEVKENALLKAAFLLLVILVLFNTIQTIRFSGTIRGIQQYKSGLADELGGFRQDIGRFGDDLNDIRNFLLLPERDYSFLQKENEENDTATTADTKTEQALYRVLEAELGQRRLVANTEKVRNTMTALQKDRPLKNGLSEQGLGVGGLSEQEDHLSFGIYAGEDAYYRIIGLMQRGEFRLQDTLSSDMTLDSEGVEELRQKILEYTANHTETIRQTLKHYENNLARVTSTLEGEVMQNLLTQKRLLLEPHTGEGRFKVLNGDSILLLDITVSREDGNIRINGEKVVDPAALSTLLSDAIDQLDGTTQTDRLVQTRRAKLEHVLQEEAFTALLDQLNYKVTPEPREDYNQLIYDVTDADGNLKFSFIIEYSSGAIKLLEGDSEKDLFSVLRPTPKKKLFIYRATSPTTGINRNASRVI